MKSPVAAVPSYALSSLAQAGVLVRPLTGAMPSAEHPQRKAHRDAHFLLVLLTEGELHLTLDFEQLTLKGAALLLISPDQVHQLRGAASPHGWGVSFEPSLVAEPMREVLEEHLPQPLLLAEQPTFVSRAESLLGLLADCQQLPGPSPHITGPMLHALLTALLHLMAGLLGPAAPSTPAGTTRGQALLAAFQRLLRQHFIDWKQPAQYAEALAVTTSHLNDTVKGLSGSSVSHHLQTRTMLEAKRLLYHSDQSVKQVGYALGYEEPVYFGKLFKKVTGQTPQAFRRTIRE
jgi:AraC family transcriptional activator of pobA